MQSGVYAITNTVTGHRYVGSTRDIADRWMHHQSTLRAGTHYSDALQAAWNEYGPGVFTLTVLEEVVEPIARKAREREHVRMLRPEYNGRGGGAGRQPFEDSRRLVTVSARLRSVDIEMLQRAGSGQLSAGIRKVCEMARAAQASPAPAEAPRETTTHGGKRPGAGRRPARPERGTASQHVAVRMWPEEVRYLRKLGDGVVSDGLHRLILLHTTTPSDDSVLPPVSTPAPAPASRAQPKAKPLPSAGTAERQRLLASITASRRPASVTAWDDDEPADALAPED